ncbi:MAG: sensor histidine kinase, partial [Acidobacteria bacterium]
PESPITIRACPEGGTVKISIKDSGPGIPQKALPHIFDRYYRVPESAERVPGTGMGLTIAREIVEAHGGRIGVESAPGQGSEFFFTLEQADEHRKNSSRR